MAHTRTRHPVQMWNGKQVPETAIDRLVVLSWKGNEKTGRVGHSARCFSVPVWSPNLSGADKDYLDILVDAVETRQKAIAHKYVSEMLASNNGVCNDIPAEILEPRSVLEAFLSEETNGDKSRGKLSAAQIGGWFKERLAPLVEAKVAEKGGWLDDKYQITPEQAQYLEQIANQYRATMERLAAPVPAITIPTAKMLVSVLKLLGENTREWDGVARKLERKLDGIINPVGLGNGVELTELL